MSSRTLYGYLSLLILVFSTMAEYELSIEFLGYKNPYQKKSDGECCDCCFCYFGYYRCDTEIYICLRSGLPNGQYDQSCKDGKKYSGILGTSSNLVFYGSSKIGRLPNPLLYSGSVIPSNGFQLYVRVEDDDITNDDLIDTIYIDIPNMPVNSSTISTRGTYRRATLILAYRLNCKATYYGSNCSTQCIPHEMYYKCGENNGEKICLSGYQNPALNCTEKSCESYCNTTGGVCVGKIPVCMCREGWVGEGCSIPTCQEDCDKIGGYCDLPGECKCHQDWTGDNCATFLCARDCSPVGGICPTPGGCVCRPGYTGENCEIDLQPCVHQQPCEHETNCTDIGDGNYSCTCQSGYTGLHCEQDIDECAILPTLLEQPCLNNSICKNYIGSYTVECNIGWEGEPKCCDTANDCLSNPCVNNATCIDRHKNYFCHCRPNYMGLNCEEYNPPPDYTGVIIGCIFGAAVLLFLAISSVILCSLLILVKKGVWNPNKNGNPSTGQRKRYRPIQEDNSTHGAPTDVESIRSDSVITGDSVSSSSSPREQGNNSM